jgi:hypothetical protein
VGGAPRRRWSERDRRSRAAGAPDAGRVGGRRPDDDRNILRRRGSIGDVRSLLWTLLRESACCGRCVRRASSNGTVLARLERPLPGSRAVDGSGQALTDHAEGADLCSKRRNRRGCDHILAGIHRRHSKLGLPLLLAARRHLHAARADASRLLRRGTRLAELAAARCRRQSRADSDPLRRRGRAMAPGAHHPLAFRIRKIIACPRRQRRLPAIAARRDR